MRAIEVNLSEACPALVLVLAVIVLGVTPMVRTLADILSACQAPAVRFLTFCSRRDRWGPVKQTYSQFFGETFVYDVSVRRRKRYCSGPRQRS